MLGRLHREARGRIAEFHARRPLLDVDNCSGSDSDLLVSLTSFPARVSDVHLTLRSILKGSAKPSEIVVVLSRDEFPNQRIPRSLARLADRGVSVEFVAGNIRSYKKLVPTLQNRPTRVIVTADDDVIYPVDWLSRLLAGHLEHPKSILGLRGTEIISSVDQLANYEAWPPAKTTTPSGRTFLTGMGGIVYPPHALPSQALEMDLAMHLCPSADDIWFKAMSLLADTVVNRITNESAEFYTLRRAQRTSLRDVNVSRGQNLPQMIAALNYFALWPKLDAA